MSSKRLSRRSILKGTAILSTAFIGAACQPKIVEVTTVVEKVVKETVVVEAASQAPETKDRVKLTVAHWGGGTLNNALDTVTKREFLSANPHIDLEMWSVPYAEHFTKITASLAAGIAPDTWETEFGRTAGYFLNDAIIDLSSLVQRDIDLSEFIGIDIATEPDGRHLAIPFEYQVDALYYNKDHFDAEGMEYPSDSWTLETMREATWKLTKDVEGKTRWGFYGGLNRNNSNFTIVRMYGTNILSDDGRTCLLGDAKSIEAYTYFADVTPPPEEEIDHNSFSRSECSMMWGQPAGAVLANRAGINYDIVKMPAGPAGRASIIAPNCFVITKASPPPQQEAAWEWIKHVISYASQMAGLVDNQGVPCNKDAAKEGFVRVKAAPDNKQAFVDAFLDGFAFTPKSPVLFEFWGPLGNELLKISSKEATVEEAVENARREVQAILDRLHRS